VKSLVVATSLCLTIIASSAFAADVSIKGNVSETGKASNNEFLKNTPSGSTLKSTTAGTLDFLARTPTTSYLLDTHYSYFKYFGPGAADTSLTWGTPASARFTMNHITMLSKFNAGASWSRADAATTQLRQSGIATARGSTDTYNIFGGVTHDLSRIDTISWSAHGSTVSFSDPTQTPYVDFTSTVAWNHKLTKRTALTSSVNFNWFSEDNPAKSQRLFWKLMSGLQSKLSPRLTFKGDIGVGFVNSYQKGNAQSGAQSGLLGVVPFQPQVGTGNAFVGDIGFTYKPLKTTTFSLTAARSIIPTLYGQLQQSSTIGLTVNHNINKVSNLSFFTQFAQTKSSNQIGQSGSSGTTSEFFTAQVRYRYRLTRKWRTNLSYTYSQRNDDTGNASSNTILFTLSRDFNVLGNPTAINQAEQERARERAQKAVGEVFPLFH
jgi:hypothetical protein